ncbi:toxin-activating lysine-acyltransferase [Vibrio sp. JC009]|uniref:toxin-activating lysine-acyltransferase n=1 Tax=Vibrio sp. JC009 TaxID=2912314 RepID=UPI0023AFABBE|nr:toxin-activating lysine-acyltransferase [Vibrio sp. JC009]WED22388.1 toxin-activating lysine-acyltransferase [Vibrio sp. JC009]
MRCYEKNQNLPISSLNALFIGREQRGKSKEEVLQELGQFLEISAKSQGMQEINISSFLHWVKPAILHDQYVFIKNEGDIEACGYVLWAWVDRNTLIEYLNKERFSLHPMCWNEGEHLIIVDFFCSDKSISHFLIKQLYRKARYQAGISYKSVNISIRDNTGSVVKHNRRDGYEY